MKFSISNMAVFVALAFSTSALAVVAPRSGSPMTHAAAAAKLTSNGISSVSSGNCSNKNNSKCTSFDGILSGTINGLIAFKTSGGFSSLIVTGGTEIGHQPGAMSHGTGYKVDIRHASAVDSHITTKFKKLANRGDGFPQWQDAAGNIYCDETNHWDIVYL